MRTQISLGSLAILMFFCLTASAAQAEDSTPTDNTVAAMQQEMSAGPAAAADTQDQQAQLLRAQAQLPDNKYFDPTKYTLGPDDVVEIAVLRHPEFSGVYPISLEGKIQYKFVGDLEITGLTKKQLEDKIKEIISAYVIDPEVNVTILEFKSKVIYVLGEVGMPGKFYMRSESIPIREAVVQAGLPTLAAAMRRCLLVTPDKGGNPKTRTVDLYSVLYGGNLKKNIEMRPGEVLYVPATLMAKIVRVISPVTQTVGVASSGPNDISSARSGVSALAK